MLLLAACSAAPQQAPEPARAEAPTAAPRPQPSAASTDAVPANPKPPIPRYRIAQRTGDARDEAGPLGTHFITGPGAALSIDLPNGARLALEAESKAVLLDGAAATLVLAKGQLYAQLLPQGGATGRAELRVVTVDCVLSVPSAGELWLAQSPPRAGYAAILSGSVELARLDGASPEAGARIETVVAPHELSAGERSARAAPPRTLDQARSAYAKGPKHRAAPPDTADADAALSRALAMWEGSESAADALLRRQREARQREDTDAVKSAQRELVDLARRKLAQRQAVRLAFEFAAARRLAADDGALAAFAAGPAVRAATAMPAGN